MALTFPMAREFRARLRNALTISNVLLSDAGKLHAARDEFRGFSYERRGRSDRDGAARDHRSTRRTDSSCWRKCELCRDSFGDCPIELPVAKRGS